MIRINLLAAERERARRGRGLQLAQKLTIACSLILVATALLIVWWFLTLRNTAVSLDRDIALAEAETARLRALIQQVQQFEERKRQVQQRVALIEQLRGEQSQAVRVLDIVSRSVPDMLWLTELTQQGNVLTIDGRCTTLTALSDFVGALGGAGTFKKPIEIVDSQVEAVQGVQVELIKFSVRAQWALPGS